MAHFPKASDFQGMQIGEPLLRGECLVPETQVWSSLHLLQMPPCGYFRVCARRATSGHLLITLVHFAAWDTHEDMTIGDELANTSFY